MSHLLQMRGLKLNNRRFDLECEESHLLQMRGLKHFGLDWKHHRHKVASFTDAWIETCLPLTIDARTLSHLLQMRGLKLKHGLAQLIWTRSHLLQMRGLKLNGKKTYNRWISRIFYRCVD